MTRFRRSGHWRTNEYGTTFWVSEHYVTRDDWGWGNGSPSSPPLNLADPNPWGRSYVSISSFTDPNATCPVCGDRVFFYQSPYGGRVFFDDLGPPWPKHPCTDNSAEARWLPIHKAPQGTPRPSPSAAEGWRPLVNLQVTEGELANYLSGYDDLDKRFVQLAVDKEIQLKPSVPTFWRPVDRIQCRAEVQFVRELRDYRNVDAFASADAVEGTANDGQLKVVRAALDGDPKEMNNIAWWRSYLFDDETFRASGWYPDKCDWEFARHWFSRAAAAGHPSAMNNLGIMYWNGYGGQTDHAEAFRLISAAANAEMDPIFLRNLAKCHRGGIGTPPDDDMADYLYELADVMEAEGGGSAADAGI